MTSLTETIIIGNNNSKKSTLNVEILESASFESVSPVYAKVTQVFEKLLIEIMKFWNHLPVFKNFNRMKH